MAELTKTIVIRPDKTASSGETPELDQLTVKPQERYKFLRSIGFGGMKGVLLVHDSDTDRDVAMAIMPDFRERPKEDLERFVREAKVTAKLEHPNIISIYDIGIDRSGSPYFTMQHLRGMTLDHLLRRIAQGDAKVEKYKLDRLLMIYLRVCNAVDFAHSRKICHLDLKPANINIGDFGEVQVIDWGLAREIGEDGFIKGARNDNNRGTPGFIAPELFTTGKERKVDLRADIFSLGAILYAMLALKPPLAGLPLEEILKRTAAGAIPRPSSIAPENRKIPAALEAVAMKALSADPDCRYNNVAELKAEIRAYNAGFATEAEHASAPQKLNLFFWRNYLYITIGALLAVVGWLIYRIIVLKHF